MLKPALEVRRGPQHLLTAFLAGTEMTIGRSSQSDLVLDDKSVSRHHARVRLREDALVIEDLGSANGVRVAGEVVSGPTPIDLGQEIRIGKFTLELVLRDATFRLRPAGEAAEVAAGEALLEESRRRGRGYRRFESDPDQCLTLDLGDPEVAFARMFAEHVSAVDPEAERAARDAEIDALELPVREAARETAPAADRPLVLGLQVYDDERVRFEKLLEGERLTIGRASDNDLRLDGPGVSRHHAALEREGDAWVLRDLGSNNGTFLNGQRVAQADLTVADELEVGRFAALFLPFDPDDRGVVVAAIPASPRPPEPDPGTGLVTRDLTPVPGPIETS